MLGVCLKYTQNNYGSKLQALATVRMLQDMSIDYEIIRYNKHTFDFLIRSVPRLFNFVFLNDRYDEIQKKIEFKKHPDVKEQVAIRNKAFDSFDINFNNNLSEVYKSYKTLKNECPNRYSGVITCSDQLWSPSALNSGFYNLMFAREDMKKASWASSFGVSKIPAYQRRRTRKYLERIQNISVRENRGAEIVKELTGRDVPVLMDPVFVYDNKEWENLVKPTAPEWEPYIFCYFLGDNPEHRAAAQELSEKTGLKIVTIRHLDRYINSDEVFGDFAPYDVDPNRFLNILRNAEYVLTDSFHGAAFSVINEKQFLVFNRYNSSSSNSKNSRIDSLCEILDLSKRRYSKGSDIEQLASDTIDYDSVNIKVARYRDETKEYLKKALPK